MRHDAFTHRWIDQNSLTILNTLGREVCPQCKARFYDPVALIEHITTVHDAVRQHTLVFVLSVFLFDWFLYVKLNMFTHILKPAHYGSNPVSIDPWQSRLLWSSSLPSCGRFQRLFLNIHANPPQSSSAGTEVTSSEVRVTRMRECPCGYIVLCQFIGALGTVCARVCSLGNVCSVRLQT